MTFREQTNHTAISMSTGSPRSLDHSNGAAERVIVDDQIDLSNIQAFFSDTGAYQDVVNILPELSNDLLLLLL